MATLWPVIVCVATSRKFQSSVRRNPQKVAVICLLLTFPNVPSAMSWMTVYSPSLDAEWGVKGSLIAKMFGRTRRRDGGMGYNFCIALFGPRLLG